MRARNIKPGFFINAELSEVDYASRLLFIGLWCYSDREGRFEWKPKQIKASIFPYDNVNIEKLLGNLMSLHVITCHDGVGYVENFRKHQHPHPHEAKSALPEKPQSNQCHDMSLHVTKCQADIMIKDTMIIDSDAIPYGEIIDYLNDKTDKKYRVGEAHKRLIRARWNDGYRLDDFKTVIDNKAEEWANDEKYSKYLAPDTLFGSKFDKYLNQTPRQQSSFELLPLAMRARVR